MQLRRDLQRDRRSIDRPRPEWHRGVFAVELWYGHEHPDPTTSSVIVLPARPDVHHPGPDSWVELHRTSLDVHPHTEPDSWAELLQHKQPDDISWYHSGQLRDPTVNSTLDDTYYNAHCYNAADDDLRGLRCRTWVVLWTECPKAFECFSSRNLCTLACSFKYGCFQET